MERQTKRADQLVAGDYILFPTRVDNEVRHILFAHTDGHSTTIVDLENRHWSEPCDERFYLADQHQAQRYEDDRDRRRVADALRGLAEQIVVRRAPVPHDLTEVSVSFELPDETDLSDWSELMHVRPTPPEPLMPTLESDALGVRVKVYGGKAGEFGPDNLGEVFEVTKVTKLDDDVFAPVGEHGDMDALVAALPAPVWPQDRATDITIHSGPLGDGHRPPVDEDAMTADRYSAGEAS